MRTSIFHTMRKTIPAVITAGLLLLGMGQLFAGDKTAGVAGKMPQEDRYIYRKMPDVPIRTAQSTVKLSRLWKEKPLIFTMVYTRCTGVCYPFLHSLKAALPEVGGLGKDYRVVVISFDPRDNTETMQRMARALGLADNPDWLFGTAAEEDIHRLAQTVGYWSSWEPTVGQYDHPAVLIGITQSGSVARFLVGATVQPVRLHEVVRELRGEFIPTYPLPGRNVIFSCFQYDPEKGVAFDWGFLLLMMPGIVTIGGTVWIFYRNGKQRAG